MTFNWRKTLLITLNVAMAAYLLLAITAFNNPDEKGLVCSQVKINIQDNIVDGFLNADEIKRILEAEKIYPLAVDMNNVNSREIEETLNKSPFVEKATCYKTASGYVIIDVAQRMPVVRIMADNGDDFYVDNHGKILPQGKIATDIIIATGPISRKYACRVLANVANAIVHDKFWKNQVEQLNVLRDGSVEMVPRVGDNIIYLGRPYNMGDKLSRMEKFYKYGLSQTGWNKYSYISVEFDNQIICKKKQHYNSI